MKSRKFKGATIALAKSSADPQLFAKRIWSACAVPSILHASEALLLRECDLKTCEKMQSRLAKSMLGVKVSTANIASQMVAGFVPFRAKYYNRVLSFFCQMRDAPPQSLIHRSYRSCKELGQRSYYWRETRKIIKRCAWNGDKKSITDCVNKYIVGFINRSLDATKKTSFAVPRATVESLGVHAPSLDFSTLAKEANSFLLLNSGLGNRTVKMGQPRNADCALCGDHLNEVHLLFVCPVLEPIRQKVGIRDFQNNRATLSLEQVFSDFWNIWSIGISTRNLRTKAALCMRRMYRRVLERRS